jgi:type II secretory pathway component GspD/PulD (secretin)
MMVFKRSEIKKALTFSLFLVLFLCSYDWGAPSVNGSHFITLRGGFLSIEAKDVSVESVFKELGEVCGISIISSENSFPSSPVTIRFKDMLLEEAVKRILKVTGVTNYLVRYQADGGSYRVSEIEFLGGKNTVQVLTSGQQTPAEQPRGEPEQAARRETTTSTAVSAEPEVDKEIETLSEKFQWDDEKTADMVKEVLKNAPPQARKYALERMTESIKNRLAQEGGREVNKETVYRAAEEAVPPNMPEMRDKVRQYLDALDKK